MVAHVTLRASSLYKIKLGTPQYLFSALVIPLLVTCVSLAFQTAPEDVGNGGEGRKLDLQIYIST